MNGRREFRPPQAEEIARAFRKEGVEYLFIGKSGTILLGYPGMTQDVVSSQPARWKMGDDCWPRYGRSG
jgi:hypothetical protein